MHSNKVGPLPVRKGGQSQDATPDLSLHHYPCWSRKLNGQLWKPQECPHLHPVWRKVCVGCQIWQVKVSCHLNWFYRWFVAFLWLHFKISLYFMLCTFIEMCLNVNFLFYILVPFIVVYLLLWGFLTAIFLSVLRCEHRFPFNYFLSSIAMFLRFQLVVFGFLILSFISLNVTQILYHYFTIISHANDLLESFAIYFLEMVVLMILVCSFFFFWFMSHPVLLFSVYFPCSSSFMMGFFLECPMAVGCLFRFKIEQMGSEPGHIHEWSWLMESSSLLCEKRTRTSESAESLDCWRLYFICHHKTPFFFWERKEGMLVNLSYQLN